MVLSCSTFTLLALIMSLFPLAPRLPRRFPSQTTPEFLLLKGKYHFRISLRFIKEHWGPRATQVSYGIGLWFYWTSDCPQGDCPSCVLALALCHHHLCKLGASWAAALLLPPKGREQPRTAPKLPRSGKGWGGLGRHKSPGDSTW